MTVYAGKDGKSGENKPSGSLGKVVRIQFDDRRSLDFLASRYDIWEVNHDENWLIAFLTETQLEEIHLAGYSYEIDPVQTEKLLISPLDLPNETGIPGYPCYRTVEETYNTLVNLAMVYPDLVRRIDIGDSWEKVQPEGETGYDLWVLVLTNPSIPGPKPAFFLMGAVHAREYVTAETATRFAEYLLSHYGKDPDVTWLLDYHEIHILAQANPDGRKKAEIGYSWRKNTDNDDGCSYAASWGVDLNRNSSFEWGGIGTSSYPCDSVYRGPSPASEPEIQALESYLREIFPDLRGSEESDPAPLDAPGLFITLHSYGELILWPWGHLSSPAPNHSELQTLGRKLAFYNHYVPQQSYELYGTSGTNDEFAYGELGVAAFTFEMGVEFFEPCEGYEEVIFPNNLSALITAFKLARRPYQEPSGPEAFDIELSSASVQQGEPVTLTVQLDDSRYSNVNGVEISQPIKKAEIRLDEPFWVQSASPTYPLFPVDGLFDEVNESANLVINTTDLEVGKHILYVHASDLADNVGLTSAIFIEIQPSKPIIHDNFLYIPWIGDAQ